MNNDFWVTRDPKIVIHGNSCIILYIQMKLEQLERLRSEDTPAASWLPIPLSHIGSQVKRRQSQITNLKIRQNFKFLNFEIGITRNTPSEVAW